LKILLTGGRGFVASYVAKELIEAGHTPVLSDVSFSSTPQDDIQRIPADLTNAQEIGKLVRDVHPDACIHLGGITSVIIGNKNPAAMFHVNVTGTAILLEAFHQHCQDARFLFVSTAHVYGTDGDDTPVTESDPLRPSNLYAVSKAAADRLTLSLAKLYDMHLMTTRPNNHVGPGQSPDFVLGTFSAQIKAISRGETPPVMYTGNLESTRDFTDVRDVARAYRLIIEDGSQGSAYNIGSGKQVSIKSILDIMCEIEGISPEFKTDPDRMRPADRSPMLDTSLIKKRTGWQPSIPLDTTIHDILQEF
jgi:GDP-4-dehydro-6-deoxy-D-mannose reductase